VTHGLGEPGMVEDRFLKRLRKKARKRLRGWPIATIAFYGPNLHQATKAAVGIVPSENAEVEELRAWIVDRGDIRDDPCSAALWMRSSGDLDESPVSRRDYDWRSVIVAQEGSWGFNCRGATIRWRS
jgi:hypothetical protein